MKTSLTFEENALPALECGKTYTIAATQSISCQGERREPDETAEVTIIVAEPGLTLAEEEVHCVYPPADSSGSFAFVIPHIILKDPTFPWIHSMGSAGEPWLALLLFHEGELNPGDTDSATGTTQGQAKVPPRCSINPNTAHWSRNLPYNYISFKADLLEKLLPDRTERKALAHVRKSPSSEDLPQEGRLSTIMGNRLPQPGKRAIVHLVSLHGWPEAVQAGTFPSNAGTVCLQSLYSWSFFCEEPSERDSDYFKTALADILANAPGQPSGTGEGRLISGDLLLRRQAGSNEFARAGYALLPWHTYSGHETLAWYRGPLAAGPSAPGEPGKVRFDKEANIFDLSLATARQTGWLLAAANTTLARDLLQLRQQVGRVLSISSRAVDYLPELVELLFKEYPAEASSAGPETSSVAGSSLPRRRQSTPYHQNSWYARILPPPREERLIRTLLSAKSKKDLTSKLSSIFDLDLFFSLAERLAKFLLLEGIDFNILVPDTGDPSSRLPSESLRCFELDMAWMESLIAGALDLVDDQSASARFTIKVLQTLVLHWHPKEPRRDELGTIIKNEFLKMVLADSVVGGATSPSAKITGVLLRSSIISDFPDLRVRAQKGRTACPVLRRAILGPEVLICLFGGEWTSLEFYQAGSSQHFEVPAGKRNASDLYRDKSENLRVLGIRRKSAVALAGEWLMSPGLVKIETNPATS